MTMHQAADGTWQESPVHGFFGITRAPYLVVPRLALEAMPLNWQQRFVALMGEMDAAGVETPEYFVFRAGDDEFTRAKLVNEETGFVRVVHGRPDPWANYRRGDIAELCPTFKAEGVPL